MGARSSQPAEVCVGGHVLEAVIGRGAFGTVFAARVRGGGRVALKLFPAARSDAAAREIAVLRRIRLANTPSTCHILESGCANDRAYITFPLRACNAYELLQQRKFSGLSPAMLVAVTRAVLAALAALHAIGLVHCDVKPENVLLSADGASAWLADFGLAQDRPLGHVTYAQSRYYRAPEVVLGAGADCEADVWSLGCTISELADGRVLFYARNEGDLYARHKALPLPAGLLARSTRSDAFLARLAVGRPAVPAGDSLVAQFAQACLVPEPRDRPSIACLADHPYARRRARSTAI